MNTKMNTKMKFESMEKALPYVAELADSEELKEFKTNVRENDLRGGELLKELLEIMLVKRRDAVFGLLGAMSGRTAEEIENQDWEETRELMKSDIMNDVVDFFTFSVRMARSV